MKNTDNVCPKCLKHEIVHGRWIAKCPKCGWWQFITPHPLDFAQRLARSRLWFWSHFLLLLGCSIAAYILHEPWLSAVAGALWAEFMLVAFGARIKHDEDRDNGNNLDV